MSPRRADALLIAATALWGVSFVIIKGALASSTPLAFTAVRFALAAALLAPFARLGTRPTRRELADGAVLAVLLATGFATQIVGLVHTTPSRSAFIVASSSVLAPVVAFAALGQRIRWWVAAALVMAGLGVYLLMAPESGGLNRGDLWTLVTAVCFGAQIVAVAELAGRHDAARLVWIQIVAIAAVTAVAAPLLEDVRMDWNPALTGALAYAVVAATVIPLVWQMRAQRHMSSARAALIFCLEPIFAAATSWLWLGERLSVMQWTGGALILLAMIVADVPLSRQSSVISSQPGNG